MERKKIALLLAQAEESYQKEFTQGVMEKAFEGNMDVYVFSMFIKYQNSKEREIGDTNIFSLVNYDAFDGIILLSDTIQTPGAEEKLQEQIHKCFKGPVICIDQDSAYFESFWTDGYRGVYEQITHLIREHQIKDIAYLTGRAAHRHSKRRVEAYRKAMEDAGLTVREDRIFYGDFWYNSGASCAENLLHNKEDLPQAVVCANDFMAIGLAEVLEQNGVKIPEDIRVAGYGVSPEGQNSPKSLMSVYVPARDYGSYAVDCILAQMEHSAMPEFSYKPSLFLGESCGCSEHLPELARRKRWQTDDSEEGFFSIHNTLLDDMQRCTTMDELLRSIYENLYYLQSVESFDLCLNDVWFRSREWKLSDFPEVGYTDTMLWAIGYRSDRPQSGLIGLDRGFERKSMVPRLEDDAESEKPQGYLFTPIFHEQYAFGYTVLNLGRATSYEDSYRLWCNAIARGLESLRRRYRMNELEKKASGLESKIKSIMMMAGEKTQYFSADQNMWKEVLSDEEREVMACVEDILNNNRFTYHFQPIVRSCDGEIYSYEALMRSNTERRVNPLEIIKEAGRMGRLVDVEKATFFNVLDIVDANKELFEKRKVFINSIPGCRLLEDDHVRVMSGIKRHPGSIVVELTEQAELSDDRLDELKATFRAMGAQMAVDDYGTGYSNVTNLLRYMPDVVKIDRALITEIQNSDQKEHFVRDIIDFCHANHIMALAEGVETTEELRCVIRLGADLIQGYYTAKPSAIIADSIPEEIKQEMIGYYREAQDDGGGGEYVAGGFSRVSVTHLMREHKSKIIVGDKDATFKDITIVGAPGLHDILRIEVLEGYKGRITLENVTLSSTGNRPCILMAENCELTLRLLGSNRMLGGGICVPESSILNIEGDGSLAIHTETDEGYGIGNGLDLRHGDINFYQDGRISIDMNGKRIVGIGSGLGGNLSMKHGKYRIITNGEKVVGVGAMEADCELTISNCELETEMGAVSGVGIGSYSGNADIKLEVCKIMTKSEGKNITGIGTVAGHRAGIAASEMSLTGSMNANLGCMLGAMNGKTIFSIEEASMQGKAAGQEVYMFGGKTEDTSVTITHADVAVDVRTKDGGPMRAPKERMSVIYARYEQTFNDVTTVVGG